MTRPLIIDSFAGGGGASEGIRYLSVCSGIEVASLAWKPLGWAPVLLSEIEDFPREMLRQRHGAYDVCRSRPPAGLVPLWGDFSALRMRHLRRFGVDPADIDVLVGGTPCQGFSVAGLRLSLSDPRGNLSLSFLRLAHAIDAARRHAGRPGLIVVWENVPGVLSTPDNALGCFLGALVGADDAVLPGDRPGRGRSNRLWRWRAAGRWPVLDAEGSETGKFVERPEAHIPSWPSAGMVAGPRGRAAWRVLDCQHFGLAQRRARVFLVGGLGDGIDPAAVLFEPAGLRGNHPAGGQTRQDLAGSLTASSGGVSGKDDPAGRVVAQTLAGGGRAAGGYSLDDIPLTATTLRARDGSKGVDSDCTDTLVPMAFGGNRQSGPISVAAALNAHGGPHGRQDFETETFVLAHTLRAEGFDASEDGTGRGTPLVPVAFDTTQITSATNRSNPQPGDPCHPLAAEGHPPAIAFDCKAGGETSFSIGALPGTLRGEGSGGGHAAVALPLGVRRLTPTECERLMGVPDGYTAISWRGRAPEDCPDGPRYRALGNAYPRPILAWLGERIGADLARAT